MVMMLQRKAILIILLLFEIPCRPGTPSLGALGTDHAPLLPPTLTVRAAAKPVDQMYLTGSRGSPAKRAAVIILHMRRIGLERLSHLPRDTELSYRSEPRSVKAGL